MTGVALTPLEGPPGEDAVLRAIRTRRGWIPNVFRMMLHSPGVTAGWVSLANALRATSFDLRTRELVILLVAHLKHSTYEWSHHERVARSAGLTDREIAALTAWPDRAAWQPADWAVLTLTAAVADNQPVPEWCLAELATAGPGYVVELTATAAYYVAVAQFTTALQVPPDNHDAVPGA